MQQLANIIVSGKTYPVREKLKQAGLSWNGKAWIAIVPVDRLEELKQLCRDYDFEYTIKGDGIKETRLKRGTRPSASYNTAAIMGEGRIEWEIKETLEIENIRSRQNQSKKSKTRRYFFANKS